jgi:uncharacterized RDD family membrane protein YckC
MQWYYSNDGQRLGPVSQAEFETLVTNGAVKAETLVWRQGMADWLPHQKVNGGVPANTPATADLTAAAEATEVCVVSGKRYPRHEMLNYEGRWISAEHRDEFFQRQREGVVQPGQFVYGNFWPRFRAKFVDGVIVLVASGVVEAGLSFALLGTWNYFTGPAKAAGSPNLIFYQVLSTVANIGLGLAYAWFFISRYSATPGKMLIGLKIVRPDGAPLSTGRIIGRHFAEWLSGLILLFGYIMAAWDPERRALHDRICDTRVIKTK